MPDLVVTVPKNFTHPNVPGKVGLQAWLGEGDPPGSEWSGIAWAFSCGPNKPNIQPNERVYVCCDGRLVGYAPLISLEYDAGRWFLIRGGGAVACTIDRPMPGFRGFRYRDWEYAEERPVTL